jgi:hypothetical protein
MNPNSLFQIRQPKKCNTTLSTTSVETGAVFYSCLLLYNPGAFYDSLTDTDRGGLNDNQFYELEKYWAMS